MTLKKNNTPSGKGLSKEQTSHSQPPILPESTKLESPPAESHCEESENQKKHWLDYVTFGMELFGLVVLAVYAGYTIKIYYANQQAADARCRQNRC